jgi:hypothetical protein
MEFDIEPDMVVLLIVRYCRLGSENRNSGSVPVRLIAPNLSELSLLKDANTEGSGPSILVFSKFKISRFVNRLSDEGTEPLIEV